MITHPSSPAVSRQGPGCKYEPASIAATCTPFPRVTVPLPGAAALGSFFGACFVYPCRQFNFFDRFCTVNY